MIIVMMIIMMITMMIIIITLIMMIIIMIVIIIMDSITPGWGRVQERGRRFVTRMATDKSMKSTASKFYSVAQARRKHTKQINHYYY